MAIQHIKAHKTASLTDLRDPRKIIDTLEDGPVAILDRNKVVAYLQHPAEKDNVYMEKGMVKKIFEKRKPEVQGAVMDMCLLINGVTIDWSTKEVGDVIIEVAQGKLDETELAAWLRSKKIRSM
jgi:hypothetical protein